MSERSCQTPYGDLVESNAILLARVAELEVDLESCHTQVSELQASDRAYAEAGADNLSLRLLLADKLATVTAERDALRARVAELERERQQVQAALTDDDGFIGDPCSLLVEDAMRLRRQLATAIAERDDERCKLRDVCMAHGSALMKICDLERDIAATTLTWTTTKPTVEGLYLRRLYGSSIISACDISRHEIATMSDWLDGEWAGPIPLPKEGQP